MKGGGAALPSTLNDERGAMRTLPIILLTTLAIASCATPVAVPDEAAAIAAAKKSCGTQTALGMPPLSEWSATRDDSGWHVHAANKVTYFGPLPHSAEMSVLIRTDGTRAGGCFMTVQE